MSYIWRLLWAILKENYFIRIDQYFNYQSSDIFLRTVENAIVVITFSHEYFIKLSHEYLVGDILGMRYHLRLNSD